MKYHVQNERKKNKINVYDKKENVTTKEKRTGYICIKREK